MCQKRPTPRLFADDSAGSRVGLSLGEKKGVSFGYKNNPNVKPVRVWGVLLQYIRKKYVTVAIFATNRIAIQCNFDIESIRPQYLQPFLTVRIPML